MNTASKLLHVLAILGAIGSATLYYLSDSDAQLARDQLDRKNSLLTEANKRAKQAADESAEVQTELTEKNEALEEARANITVLSSRNTQLKRETQRFTEELDERVKSEEKLQVEIARLERENAKIKASSVALEEVQVYTQQIASLEEEVLQLKNTNARFPGNIASANTENSTIPEDLKGKILTVGPQSSFVVLNVGYEDGLRLTHSLSVARGTNTIAQIEITEVKENLSIARILPESLKLHVKEGDVVSPL
ncbi:hypothetical protein MLD52_06395 [Puniceicoccaceae bacterium K14]|nr:hypothetical protein [Puniceicoccaceae bacterium K14]